MYSVVCSVIKTHSFCALFKLIRSVTNFYNARFFYCFHVGMYLSSDNIFKYS